MPYRQIRAVFDTAHIRVYQAYSHDIADAALTKGTFSPPSFSMARMTWIKPSFLWMMYRAGWGFKDDGQRRILAIDISREGFEWALTHSSLSHTPHASLDPTPNVAPVRIQWDPERDLLLRPLPYRTIQIGLSQEALNLYVSRWIKSITDITPLAHTIHTLVTARKLDEAKSLLPIEIPYPVSSNLSTHLAIED